MESLVTAQPAAEAPAVETQTEQPTGQEPGASWFWGEGVPGNGDAPDYLLNDKYKSVAEQAKGYKELLNRYNDKFKGFVGAPENGYERPESIKEDSPLMDMLTQVGQKYNMSQDMFNDLIENYTGIVGQFEQERLEKSEARIKEELGKLGENASARLTNIADYAKANLDADGAEELINMATTAKSVEVIERLINGSKQTKMADPSKSAQVPENPYEKLREMQFATNENGQRLIEVDMNHRKKYDELVKAMSRSA